MPLVDVDAGRAERARPELVREDGRLRLVAELGADEPAVTGPGAAVSGRRAMFRRPGTVDATGMADGGQGGIRALAGRRRALAGCGAVVVAAASGTFGVLAAAVALAGATQRHRAWAGQAAAMVDAGKALAAADGFTTGPGDTLDRTLALVPSPAAAAGAIAGRLLAEVLLFAAVCALVHVLATAGRRVAAAAVTVAVPGAVLASAGPFGRLCGTLAEVGTVEVHGIRTPDVTFSAPWWWRAVGALAVALPLAATAVVGYRRRRPPGPGTRAWPASAAFLLVTEILVLLRPDALAPDGVDTGTAAVAAATLLVLGWAGADAGSRRGGVRGLGVAALLGALGLLAAYVAWEVHHGDASAPGPVGWEPAAGPAPWAGTPELVLLAALAPLLGRGAAAAHQRVRRAVHGRAGAVAGDVAPEAPPRHAGTVLVTVAALVVGLGAGAAVGHRRTEEAARVASADRSYRYAEAVSLAARMPAPAGAVERAGGDCAASGLVRCWTVHRELPSLEGDLTTRLAAATRLTPYVLSRSTLPSRISYVREGVDVGEFRIEVQIATLATWQDRRPTLTGDQSVVVTVVPGDPTS